MTNIGLNIHSDMLCDIAGGRKSSDTSHGSNHRVGNALLRMDSLKESMAGACLPRYRDGLLLFLPKELFNTGKPGCTLRFSEYRFSLRLS
jgi:hypothetical protein